MTSTFRTDNVNRPLQLDEILLELGCFDKECRSESLERICKLAVKREDPTAKVVIASSPSNEDDIRNEIGGGYHQHNEVQDVLETHSKSKTLFLHNFVEPSSTTMATKNLGKRSRREPETSRSLPMSNSSSLQQLCLSHCTVHADTIKFLAASKNLQVLIVWNCTVRRGLENLTSLEALVLVDCCIAEVPLQRIISKSAKLKRFALIRSGNLPNLQRRTSYYVSNPKKFSLALQANASIQKLVIGDSMLPDSEFANTTLLCCPHLQSLSLNSTLISDTFASSLAEALTSETQLQELVLSKVRWSPTGAIVISNAIRQNTSLKVLDLSHTLWFGPDPIEALQRMIQYNTSLHQIQLNSLEYSSLLCNILGAVMEGISQNQTLTCIDLAGNHLSEDAMIALHRILCDHNSLKQLSLRDCYYAPPSNDSDSSSINDEQHQFESTSSRCKWKLALSGLTQNRTLENLSLEDCRIGNIAAKTVGKILLTNSTLKSIDLCRNGIDDDGVQLLVDGLKQNQTLQKIFLHGNEISKGGSKILHDTIRDSNQTLRVIFLPSSPYQEEIQYYGSINYAGRKHIGNANIQLGLWPTILERVASNKQPDMLFYLIQHKPELFHHTQNNRQLKHHEEQREVISRKRSRGEENDNENNGFEDSHSDQQCHHQRQALKGLKRLRNHDLL